MSASWQRGRIATSPCASTTVRILSDSVPERRRQFHRSGKSGKSFSGQVRAREQPESHFPLVPLFPLLNRTQTLVYEVCYQPSLEYI